MEDEGGSDCGQVQAAVGTLTWKAGAQHLRLRRSPIPSSLALCLPDLRTLLNPPPEASLPPVPTLSG